jgi:hypothetical protein
MTDMWEHIRNELTASPLLTECAGNRNLNGLGNWLNLTLLPVDNQRGQCRYKQS